ncbi:MAG: tetronasin resistance protein [Exiguobacterium indicum]
MRFQFTCWQILLSQYLRRDSKKIIIWTFGVTLFTVGFIPSFEEMAKGDSLRGLYETLKNPAMISMIGTTPVSIADYTLGAMFSHQMLIFCALLSMVLSSLHVIQHTRKEEDLGLTELMRSFQIGRQANSLAILIEVILINLSISILISGALIAFQVETFSNAGAALFGLSVGAAGILGATFALLIAQIMPSSSSATAGVMGWIGLLYLGRAGTDVSNDQLSVLNPLGWTYLTYPFTENNWLFLVMAIGVSLILMTVALVLENHRDMGAGYLPEKEGRATANRSLLSIRGLLIRISRGSIIVWMVAFLIMALAYGSIYGDMQTFIDSNATIQQMFTVSGVTIEESFTGTIMMIMMVLVAILPITLMNRLYTEEDRRRLSPLFATKVSRQQLYWNTIGLAVASSLISMFIVISSLGFTAISVMGPDATMTFTDFFIAGINYLPSVLLFLGLAALFIGWRPTWSKLTYVCVTYSFFIGYFGGIIDLPKWVEYTAIQGLIPQVPTEDFDGLLFGVLLVVACLLVVIGQVGYARRDFQEGS